MTEHFVDPLSTNLLALEKRIRPIVNDWLNTPGELTLKGRTSMVADIALAIVEAPQPGATKKNEALR